VSARQKINRVITGYRKRRYKMMTELQDKANDAFYAWEIANNEQDLSDRDRMIWTAGWIQAHKENEE
jgi:hypothetical protein